MRRRPVHPMLHLLGAATLAMTVALVGACEQEPPPPQLPPTDPDAREAAPAPEPLVTVVRGRHGPSDEEPQRGGGGGGGQEEAAPQPQRLANELRDMTREEALAFAEEILAEPVEGNTVCGRLYVATTRVAAAMHEREPRMRIRPLTRDSFMTSCQRLPPEMQRCLVPAYQRTHEHTCRRTLHRTGAAVDAEGANIHRVDAAQVDREAARREAASVARLGEEERGTSSIEESAPVEGEESQGPRRLGAP